MAMAFGEFLADARGERSQQEVADKLGVTQPTISAWETGENFPRRTRLADVAQVYGVPVDKVRRLWLTAERKTEAA